MGLLVALQEPPTPLQLPNPLPLYGMRRTLGSTGRCRGINPDRLIVDGYKEPIVVLAIYNYCLRVLGRIGHCSILGRRLDQGG